MTNSVSGGKQNIKKILHSQEHPTTVSNPTVKQQQYLQCIVKIFLSILNMQNRKRQKSDIAIWKKTWLKH